MAISLLLYAGKQYEIVEHEDLAVLYFTDDPLTTLLFFNKIGDKLRINVAAEIRNSRNHVGGVYRWSFNPHGRDEFARALGELLVNIRGYYRFRDGDNRELPVKIDAQKGAYMSTSQISLFDFDRDAKIRRQAGVFPEECKRAFTLRFV